MTGHRIEGLTLPKALCWVWHRASGVLLHICKQKRGHRGKHRCGIGKCGKQWAKQ